MNLVKITLLLAASLGITGAQASGLCDNPARLRFSLVPQSDAKKDAAAFRPLLDALETALNKPVEVIMPSSYGSVVEGLVAGSIDIAIMGPASYVQAKNLDPDIHAFASTTKAGHYQEDGPFYRALLVTRSDSRFTTKESLQGARLALVDPDSTSGSIIPRALYAKTLGMPLEHYFGNVAYSGGHDKSASALIGGQVDAAFIASVQLSGYIAEFRFKKEDFRVLWQSEPIPRDPLVYRGRLCDPIREKIRKVFLSADANSHSELFKRLNATRFAPITDESYKTIREILKTKF